MGLERCTETKGMRKLSAARIEHFWATAGMTYNFYNFFFFQSVFECVHCVCQLCDQISSVSRSARFEAFNQSICK